MRLDEAGVGPPHDFLELPKLAEETWIAVVHLFGGFVHERVDIPCKEVSSGSGDHEKQTHPLCTIYCLARFLRVHMLLPVVRSPILEA